MSAQDTSSAAVLLVTGMSGAGKTSALKSLEDIGYEAVDNVPLSLLSNLTAPAQRNLPGKGLTRPLAIGADIRTRDFDVESFRRHLESLVADSGAEVKMLFMDCDDDELQRRYTETRHRHPLALDRPVRDGIQHERRLVSGLRDCADVVLDTTGLGPGELKHILQGHFGLESKPKLSICVTSFSFRHGLPREADLVFDVRFLANPHYDPDLRGLTGKDKAVAEYIGADKGLAAFFGALTALLEPLLPRYAAEGKSYLTIAVGCTGGRHRSVFVAEKLAAWLEERVWPLNLNHRDLAKGNGQKRGRREV